MQLMHRRYPLHHAAASAAPRAVVAELLRLFPAAAQKQTVAGEYPLHLATKAAAELFTGGYGQLLRRASPATAVRKAAADCVELLLQVWPMAAMACDALGVPPQASARDQMDECGWWPLHTALYYRAPPEVLSLLRAHTPCNALGAPKIPNPGRRGATRSTCADLRVLPRDDKRTLQLRYLLSGARGVPKGLKWVTHDIWGEPLKDGGGRKLIMTADDVGVTICHMGTVSPNPPPDDPSVQDLSSLEPRAPELEGDGDDDEDPDAWLDALEPELEAARMRLLAHMKL